MGSFERERDRLAVVDAADETARNTDKIAESVWPLSHQLETVQGRLADIERRLEAIAQSVTVIRGAADIISFLGMASAAVYVWDRWIGPLFAK